MENKVEKKLSGKKIVSLVAIALAFIAIILYIVLPAIKIGPSFAFNDQVNAGKENFIAEKDWVYRVFGFEALFGGASYDVIKCGIGSEAYVIHHETETTAFNICMLLAIIIAVAAIVLYSVMFFKKIKNATLNKVVIVLFVAAALMVLLTAVWFYAFNPIEESNYYDSVTKQDTLYKYSNASLSAGPISGSILLVASGICTALGEY